MINSSLSPEDAQILCFMTVMQFLGSQLPTQLCTRGVCGSKCFKFLVSLLLTNKHYSI
jgi:hypothetical protein